MIRVPLRPVAAEGAVLPAADAAADAAAVAPADGAALAAADALAAAEGADVAGVLLQAPKTSAVTPSRMPMRLANGACAAPAIRSFPVCTWSPPEPAGPKRTVRSSGVEPRVGQNARICPGIVDEDHLDIRLRYTLLSQQRHEVAQQVVIPVTSPCVHLRVGADVHRHRELSDPARPDELGHVPGALPVGDHSAGRRPPHVVDLDVDAGFGNVRARRPPPRIPPGAR